RLSPACFSSGSRSFCATRASRRSSSCLFPSDSCPVRRSISTLATTCSRRSCSSEGCRSCLPSGPPTRFLLGFEYTVVRSSNQPAAGIRRRGSLYCRIHEGATSPWHRNAAVRRSARKRLVLAAHVGRPRGAARRSRRLAWIAARGAAGLSYLSHLGIGGGGGGIARAGSPRDRVRTHALVRA